MSTKTELQKLASDIANKRKQKQKKLDENIKELNQTRQEQKAEQSR